MAGRGRLAGKAAIVTGAAGGIGRAISLRFAEEGAGVVAADIDGAGAERTAGAVAEAGGRAMACACDVSQSRSAKAAVEAALKRFGAIHVLVNNAAIWVGDASVVDLDEADWQRAVAVNLTGAFLMSKHAVPAIIAAGGGSVIHVASQLAHVARPGRPWYCATKGALIQLARAMAVDHAAGRVRVNTLSPGPTLTEKNIALYGGIERVTAEMGGRTLFNRLAEPREIAEAAVFLASDESSFMTGADLLVDGGYLAR
ncbi:MAG: glucose 1-dehydrogenase [Proteobacteria bacterium]|nr:glucose 1-dehydrogenase [Pseudomonadota bacterium]